MTPTAKKLESAVQTYLADLRRVRASGGATGERSIYGPLANLLNDIGATLRPKVFCVGELAQQGAGHPDFGLYAAKQLQRGKPRDGQLPECGVVEVKSPDDDAWLTARSDQVSRYWQKYGNYILMHTGDASSRSKEARQNCSGVVRRARPTGNHSRAETKLSAGVGPAYLPTLLGN